MTQPLETRTVTLLTPSGVRLTLTLSRVSFAEYQIQDVEGQPEMTGRKRLVIDTATLPASFINRDRGRQYTTHVESDGLMVYDGKLYAEQWDQLVSSLARLRGVVR